MGICRKEYSWRLISLIHISYTGIILLCMLKENFQKPTCWIFCFFSYSCWGGLIQMTLIHFHKNIKTTLTLSINVRLKVTRVFCVLNSIGIDKWKSLTYKIVHWTKHSIITIYIKDRCNIIFQSLSFQLQTFLFFLVL